MTRSFHAVLLTAVGLGALCAAGGTAQAQTMQTNLVSDIMGLAKITDPNLVNPWGVSFAAGTPIWISDQGTQLAPLYPVMGSTGVDQALFNVNIPPAGVAGPTGQVANTLALMGNPAAGFDVSVGSGGNGKPADFIFANLNGSISAWNNFPHTQALTQVTVAGASYTGLAINSADTELFAANDKAGTINVFNSSFTQVMGAGFATPPGLPAGLVPFNVKVIGTNVFVTYALAGHGPQTTAALGEGAVAEFTEGGVFESLSPVSADNKMASPWGIALAPNNFGEFAGDLLVGNFAYSQSPTINAFNPTNWDFEGSITINTGGQPAGGLWSLAFGGSGDDGNARTLFFTDGLNGEKDGLFGALTVPEPSTWAMMLLGFGGLAFLAARRRAALAIG